MRICSVEGCEGKHKAKGYCNKHYRKLLNYGDVSIVKVDREKRSDTCTVEGCKEKHNAKGYCNKHYKRFTIYGDVSIIKLKKEKRSDTCTVEGCEGKHEAKGYCNKHYLRFKKFGSPHEIMIYKESDGYCSVNNCENKHFAKSYCLKHYEKFKMKNDTNFKVSKTLRNRIRKSIKNDYKSQSSFELLGCTIEQVREHLESQFRDGMTWDNHGSEGWHIDHIKPCASFDLTDPEQQKECFHYTNLQPLWASENLSKGDKLDWSIEQ